MSANATVNSITTRGAIDVTALVCVLCKEKHGGAGTCYAHTMSSNGKPICIFCEDGEPCMFEQRQTKDAKKSPISVVKKSLTPGSGTVPREAHNLETSGSTPVPATSSKVAAPPQQVVPPQPATHSKEKSMNTAVRPNGHAQATAPRLCKCDCGETVPAGNRFAYIKGHMSRGGKRKTSVAPNKRGRPSNASKVAAGEMPIRAVPTPAAESQFALQVNEAQLDRFLALVDWNAAVPKLPPEMKATLVNHYFAAGLDQVEAKAEGAAA